MAYADIEKRRAYQREWHRQHRAANPGIDEKYRKATKEERAAERRRQRAKPESRHKEVLIRSYEKHKAKRNAEMKAWRKANWELQKKHLRVAKAKRRAAEGKFTVADIARIFEEQRGICGAPHCATSIENAFEIDHIQPLSKGGTNWPSNIRLLCQTCNRSKGYKTDEEWMQRRQLVS